MPAWFEATPFPWSDERAAKLLDLLGAAYEDVADIRYVAQRAGVELGKWSSAGGYERAWRSLLEIVANQGKVPALLDVVLRDGAVRRYHAAIRQIMSNDAVGGGTSGAHSFDLDRARSNTALAVALVASTLGPALPALRTSQDGRICLLAVACFLLASGLAMLAAMASGTASGAKETWHRGRLIDAWERACAGGISSITTGGRGALAAYAGGLAAAFLILWRRAHPRLQQLDEYQLLPQVLQVIAAIVLGGASWFLICRQARTARWTTSDIAIVAWWCLPKTETAVDAILNGDRATYTLQLLVEPPHLLQGRDVWLLSAPAFGPVSAAVSLGLALLVARCFPEAVARRHPVLPICAALAAVGGAVCMALHR